MIAYRSSACAVTFWGTVKTLLSIIRKGVKHGSGTVEQAFVSISIVLAINAHLGCWPPTTVSTFLVTCVIVWN